MIVISFTYTITCPALPVRCISDQDAADSESKDVALSRTDSYINASSWMARPTREAKALKREQWAARRLQGQFYFRADSALVRRYSDKLLMAYCKLPVPSAV